MCHMAHKALDLTTFRDLADSYLQVSQGCSLIDWLQAEREAGHSYRHMARRLETVTEGNLVVSYRTLARWNTKDAA